MRHVSGRVGAFKQIAAIDVNRLAEDEARAILEAIRWPEGPICVHCGSEDTVRIEGRSEKVRDGLLRCKDCRRQFTVSVGTVMERSHLTLRQWVHAFHAMCSHENGVSALQLQRTLALRSYGSAWRLAHRIRLAMRQAPLADVLQRTVELDEVPSSDRLAWLGREGHV